MPVAWSRGSVKLRHRTALCEDEAVKRFRNLAESLPLLRQAVQRPTPVVEEVLQVHSRDSHRTQEKTTQAGGLPRPLAARSAKSTHEPHGSHGAGQCDQPGQIDRATT